MGTPLPYMMTTIYRKRSIPTHKSESFVIKIVPTNEGLVARIQAEKFYRHFINTHAKAGQEGTLKLELKKPLRSVSQNNFYWMYLGLISLSSGHTPKELHAWASGKFLSTGITEIFGDKVRKVNSTTELTIIEFAEYLARIELTTDIPLPDPEPFNLGLTNDEYYYIKMEQKSKYSRLIGNKIV